MVFSLAFLGTRAAFPILIAGMVMAICGAVLSIPRK
jgi:hypothetical protein